MNAWISAMLMYYIYETYGCGTEIMEESLQGKGAYKSLSMWLSPNNITLIYFI